MERREYRVSRRRLILAQSAGVLLLLAVLPLREDRGALFLGVGAFLVTALWVWFAAGLEYRLDRDGITRSTRLGATTLRWDQLEELWYRGEKRSVNLIPLGTYVTLWLRDVAGQGMTISGGGNYFGYLLVSPSAVDSLQQRVLEAAAGPLAARLRSRLDAGQAVALGPVTVSLAAGVAVRGLLKSHTVPLNRLAGVGVHDGHLYFFEEGAKKSLAPAPVAKVPNVPALLAVLKALGVRETAMSAGFIRPSAT